MVTSHHFVRWHSPSTEFIKLNFDGLLINKSATGGFILRDWVGKLIKVGVIHYGEPSILVAEARALKNRVIAAIQAGYQNIIIEGDNNTVIQALQGIYHVPWKIATILEDVKLWLTTTNCTIIRHIVWEAN